MGQIWAPWTPEQVDALNRFQQYGGMHPFTCGSPTHLYESPVLVAWPDGWHCPWGCGYRQVWALAFMADPSAWPKPFGERHGPMPQEMQQVSAGAFAERVAAVLSDEAYECDGDCGLSERDCWDAHPFNWTATINGVKHVSGSVKDIAKVVVTVCREMGILPPE